MKIFGKISSFFIITAFAVALSVPVFAGERTIPYPKSYDIISSGASSYLGSSNHPDSIYFAAPDYFEMQSDNDRTIISHYLTYQQTTEFTCGPASALTVLYYYGEKSYDELKISKMMGTLFAIDKNGEVGTSTAKIVNFFKSIGWDVTSSLSTAGIDGTSFEDIVTFKDFVLSCLKHGIPIMVENIYMGGHWRVIIGYDTLGSPRTQDDVLIFADSYDVNDHKQDGFMAESAENFFYTWLDLGMLPKDQRDQQWVVAYPMGTNFSQNTVPKKK
jgi:hypothetical protein